LKTNTSAKRPDFAPNDFKGLQPASRNRPFRLAKRPDLAPNDFKDLRPAPRNRSFRLAKDGFRLPAFPLRRRPTDVARLYGIEWRRKPLEWLKMDAEIAGR
jgi:hypothetical protein